MKLFVCTSTLILAVAVTAARRSHHGRSTRVKKYNEKLSVRKKSQGRHKNGADHVTRRGSTRAVPTLPNVSTPHLSFGAHASMKTKREEGTFSMVALRECNIDATEYKVGAHNRNHCLDLYLNLHENSNAMPQGTKSRSSPPAQLLFKWIRKYFA